MRNYKNNPNYELIREVIKRKEDRQKCNNQDMVK